MENGNTPTRTATDNVNTVDTGTVGSAKYTVPNDYLRNIDLNQFPQPAEGFVVRAELKKTSDKGIGVFACEFIPANASVYDCNNTLYTLLKKKHGPFLILYPPIENESTGWSIAMVRKGKLLTTLTTR